MLNFRVASHEIDLIDRASRAAGKNRSAFMKGAVMSEVQRFLEAGSLPAALPPKAPVVTEGPTVSRDQCGHPRASQTKTAWGVKLCTLCGAKLR